ncbi:MAG: hypothetical protein J5382_09935 [Bacteroidales bacterium]|nr:hypothetical protein [Bacteroidales bacterium]
MKRIISIIVMMACAAVLTNSCQISTLEVKEGVPMTIQASVVAQANTKTIYDYTDEKTLEGYWDSEEAITVVSFGQGGITAVDKFVSYGERGRSKAEFSGTWNGNQGDRIICLYPPVDEYAGNSIFDGVREGSPTIYMRNLSTASGALQHDEPASVSDVDLMLGEVKISGDVAHVYLEHQLAVFRIEVTLKDFRYEAPPGSPFDQARINTIRIKCVDPDSEEEEDWGVNGDPVFVRFSGMDVTTDSYSGKPFAIERGPLDYYLLDSGNYSELTLMDDDDVVEKTFFVPVRFDRDLEEGYELCFQFGGNYYDDEEERRNSVTVFPGCDKRATIKSKLPLENGKIYCFKVTI